jgi:anti-sigma factor RsiW
MTVCSGSLEHVELALLEGSELTSAVQGHLSTCSSCAAEAETLKGIVAALQASPTPAVPADLAARLVPVVLLEAGSVAHRGIVARMLRPAAAFVTAFGAAVAFIVTIGTAFVVAAVITTRISPPASERPLPSSEPSVEPS